MPQVIEQLKTIIEQDLGVHPAYKHSPKRITPGEPLERRDAVLKWYGLHKDDRPIPDAITALARRTVAESSLDMPGLGFVILHLCGADFYFLIVCTWRNENELWSTVFYKNGDAMPAFAPWPRDGTHKPAFCVWELAPVWHEQQAWVRFLRTPRDASAGGAWLADRTSGPA